MKHLSYKYSRKWWLALSVPACALLAVALLAIAMAGGKAGAKSQPSGAAPVPRGWISTHERVLRHEALPCTGIEDPINFEVFSSGPEVGGLPMTAAVRRCDFATPAYEEPANRLTYSYGTCEIEAGETGCAPPLEVQTWPACQRSLADYSFEGEPIPHRLIGRLGGAKVVEFDFLVENRIEVYAKSSTVVIFADSPGLAREAVSRLTPQMRGTPPATRRDELQKQPPGALEPPVDGATEGELKCQA